MSERAPFLVGYLDNETNQSALPKSSDVVIVGGGLLGTSLAYYLAKAGVETVLLERDDINREASGTNAGSFHFQIALHQLTPNMSDSERRRLADEVRLQVDAASLWDEIEKELNADLGVHFDGGIMVAETQEEMRVLQEKDAIEKEAGLESHILTGDEMRTFAPYLAPDLAGISFCPREGHANPLLVGPTYAYRAWQNGALFRTGCDVTKIERINNGGDLKGRRFRILTSRGDIECNRVVNATGAWAAELSAQLGLRIPLGLSGLHVNVTEPREYFLKSMVQHIGRRLTLKQTHNNTFIIGGGWPSREEKFPKRYSNTWSSTTGNLAVALRVLPMLSDVKLLRTWSGVWAYTRDFKPILGESEKVPGYHIAMVPTGFTLGPMVAQMLADYMTAPSGSVKLPAEFNIDREVA
jgi:glycine/D-amino acid oxidase-like deaminating enzyme